MESGVGKEWVGTRGVDSRVGCPEGGKGSVCEGGEVRRRCVGLVGEGVCERSDIGGVCSGMG